SKEKSKYWLREKFNKAKISSNITNGWNIATDVRDSFDEDPMEAFFQKKLLSNRQLISISIGTKIREAHEIDLGISKRS
ncbi:35212_t:CDS:2, partial [Gigaspora margarita]